jgi:hypothetical protein
MATSAFKRKAPGATAAQIASLTSWLGHEIPGAYRDLLAETDGAETWWDAADGHGRESLVLWSTGEVPELNEAYEIGRYLPGIVAIGSDGGDDAIVLDMTLADEADAWPVVRIGFGNLDRQDFVLQAPTFEDWARDGFRLKPGWWT